MITAVIPAYQAAGSVGEVVRRVRPLVDRVIVVDDGSEDGTGAAAGAAGAQVLRHRVNCGKGAALRSGIQTALIGGARQVATLDADGQHDPADLPNLKEAMEQTGAALVIGSRLHDISGVPTYRWRTIRIGDAVIRFMTGVSVEDAQSGFRLYRASVLREIRIRSDGFPADSEILVRLCRRGYRPVPAPIRVLYTPEISRGSHFQPIRDTTRISWTVLKIVLGLY